MASGLTDKGVAKSWDVFFRGATPPTTLYLALVTSAVTPTKSTNTLSELTEITAGNGYTSGGIAVSRNSTDFDTLTEADPVVLQLKDLAWTASGGSIPASGSGARFAVLTDDNGTVGSREVYAYFDLGSDRTVSTGQDLTIQDAELNGDV